jgi:hypothetical protein
MQKVADLTAKQAKSTQDLASPEGLEPPTHVLEGHCSIQMSYGLCVACILGRRWARQNPAWQQSLSAF